MNVETAAQEHSERRCSKTAAPRASTWARIVNALYHGMPAPLRVRARRLVGAGTRAAERQGLTGIAYRLRLAIERARYASQVNVHDLPPIFHYWSNTHLAPIFREMGVNGIDDFFADACASVAGRTAGTARFVSIGSGNCDTEVRLASLLKARGLDDFTLECLDINPAMLARGRELARGAGVDRQVVPRLGDFNDWKPSRPYDVVIANQSLHHVVNLESLFDGVGNALTPHGAFVVSDIIGRNGHARWPEALEILRAHWAGLPPSYKYNHLLHRQEDEFLDWDCSKDGFEGIRAQDILPLLVERFDFELFIGFGNVIDPFIDRAFGPNFNPDAAWDREVIDRIHRDDETALLAGTIKPTHMLAIMGRSCGRPLRIWRHLSPEFCVRKVAA